MENRLVVEDAGRDERRVDDHLAARGRGVRGWRGHGRLRGGRGWCGTVALHGGGDEGLAQREDTGAGKCTGHRDKEPQAVEGLCPTVVPSLKHKKKKRWKKEEK